MQTPSESLVDLSEHIAEELGGKVTGTHFDQDEMVITANKEDIQDVLRFLRDDIECQFKILLSVCGVDYPDREKRFEIIYTMLSLSQNNRVRIKVHAKDEEFVPSVESVFSSAGWFEREVWDMYGVPFEGNSDMRRILTDYGFEGHPLRKDFPLTGYVELRYDEEQRRVVYEPVQLTQDFRTFDALSPWEGMTDVQLPGDEKAVKPKFGWEASEKLPQQLQAEQLKKAGEK